MMDSVIINTKYKDYSVYRDLSFMALREFTSLYFRSFLFPITVLIPIFATLYLVMNEPYLKMKTKFIAFENTKKTINSFIKDLI